MVPVDRRACARRADGDQGRGDAVLVPEVFVLEETREERDRAFRRGTQVAERVDRALVARAQGRREDRDGRRRGLDLAERQGCAAAEEVVGEERGQRPGGGRGGRADQGQGVDQGDAAMGGVGVVFGRFLDVRAGGGVLQGLEEDRDLDGVHRL